MPTTPTPPHLALREKRRVFREKKRGGHHEINPKPSKGMTITEDDQMSIFREGKQCIQNA